MGDLSPTSCEPCEFIGGYHDGRVREINTDFSTILAFTDREPREFAGVYVRTGPRRFELNAQQTEMLRKKIL